MVAHVAEEAFGAKPIAYAAVIELDRKLRELPVPATLRTGCVAQGDSVVNKMRSWFITHYTESGVFDALAARWLY